jgi:hypothetical protein
VEVWIGPGRDHTDRVVRPRVSSVPNAGVQSSRMARTRFGSSATTPNSSWIRAGTVVSLFAAGPRSDLMTLWSISTATMCGEGCGCDGVPGPTGLRIWRKILVRGRHHVKPPANRTWFRTVTEHFSMAKDKQKKGQHRPAEDPEGTNAAQGSEARGFACRATARPTNGGQRLPPFNPG